MHACSSAARPIALESMHTQRMFGAYSHVHANNTRRCSCQAGPRHTNSGTLTLDHPESRKDHVLLALAPPGAICSGLHAHKPHALMPASSTATHSMVRWSTLVRMMDTQRPPGDTHARVIPRRINAGMFAQIHACSNTAYPTALEPMHTRTPPENAHVEQQLNTQNSRMLTFDRSGSRANH